MKAEVNEIKIFGKAKDQWQKRLKHGLRPGDVPDEGLQRFGVQNNCLEEERGLTWRMFRVALLALRGPPEWDLSKLLMNSF